MTPKSFGNAFARLGKRASMPSSTRTCSGMAAATRWPTLATNQGAASLATSSTPSGIPSLRPIALRISGAP